MRVPPRVALWALILWSPAILRSEAPAPAPPYTVSPGLFDAAAPDLGLRRLPGVRTFTVFRPDAGEGADRFNNGAALVAFKGRLLAQWQSSARDEDSPDTWVAFSQSADGGATWSPPHALIAAGADGEMRSSGGWWTDGERLVAFVNVWPTGFQSGAGGHAVYLLSDDGETWSEPRRVLGRDGQPVAGIIEQDIHAYDGRLHTAFHLQPGLIAAPHHTDDPLGLGGWTRGRMENLPHNGATSRELEPSLFRAGDRLVMVFRDQASTYRQLAAESRDRGETWTTPTPTAMPDSRSKQSAGNLPGAAAFLVNCPRAGKERIPLAITLSPDGRVFDRSFLLRGANDLPPLRQPGKYKRPGYHYPKSLVADGHLHVIYSVNKEDVELTRVPLDELEVK